MKKVAGVTIKSFDSKCIDSDLDTIQTEVVRDKVNKFKAFRKAESPIKGETVKYKTYMEIKKTRLTIPSWFL